QEIVNALYETLFTFLPITPKTAQVEEPSRNISWTQEANTVLDAIIAKTPFISQISLGRELKKKAEALAAKQGKDTVTPDLLQMLK
ncbi:MAG: chlorophyllide reductase subunit Z, partial [Chlorobium phaeobacteroides]|nr:chlorophyllide reductase subunit Z [Chlorobium phaeobacteroides]